MNFCKLTLSVFVFAAAIAVGSASAVCSNATLIGTTGFLAGGSDTSADKAMWVGQFIFDGLGNFTGQQTRSLNGTITTKSFSGTYSVSAKCAVTLTVTVNGTGTFSGALDDGNHGFQFIDTRSGDIITGFDFPQGTVTCGLTGKKQIFAANLAGTTNSNGAVAFAGQVILDGNGNVSGSLTWSLGGTIGTSTLSGTYTENSDCTGTMQVTPSGLGPANLNFVLVNGGKEGLLIQTDAGTLVSGTMQR